MPCSSSDTIKVLFSVTNHISRYAISLCAKSIQSRATRGVDLQPSSTKSSMRAVVFIAALCPYTSELYTPGSHDRPRIPMQPTYSIPHGQATTSEERLCVDDLRKPQKLILLLLFCLGRVHIQFSLHSTIFAGGWWPLPLQVKSGTTTTRVSSPFKIYLFSH